MESFVGVVACYVVLGYTYGMIGTVSAPQGLSVKMMAGVFKADLVKPVLYSLSGDVGLQRVTLDIQDSYGNINLMTVNESRQFESFNDMPGVVQFDKETGCLVCMVWYRNGKEHREGGKPSYVKFYPDGRVEIERWFVSNVPYRENGEPTTITYHPCGGVKMMLWRGDGRLCEDLPSVVSYYPSGALASQEWHDEGGSLHREGCKPSAIYYFEDGSVKEMS